MMGVVFFLGFGIVAGLFAWAVSGGRARRDLATTIAIGLTGSFCGDTLLSYTVGEHLYVLHRCGVVGSVAGAVCLLFAACGILQDTARPRDNRRAEYESRRLMPGEADRHSRSISPRPSPLYLASPAERQGRP